ncbi:MAG: hypothetical protein WC965_01400 [Thiohalomonadaceae bacterium]
MIESLDRWWSNLTFPVRRRVFGWATRVNWERGGLYLINFDQSLASVILEGLRRFRKYNIGVIYEDEDGADLTEWWFDEVIWTFEAIKNGGSSESDALYKKAYASATHEFVPVEGTDYTESVVHGVDETLQAEWLAQMRKDQERIDNGLKLFAEKFQSLWL